MNWRSAWPFWTLLWVVGGSYIVLILGLLLADFMYTRPGLIVDSLDSPDIKYAIKLSLVSCSISTLLSIWVAVPLGYLLARTHFPGKVILDTLVDIPIVLPPLVIGLSLMILFRTPPGQWTERMTEYHLGEILAYVAFPGLIGLFLFFIVNRSWAWPKAALGSFAFGLALSSLLYFTPAGQPIATNLQARFGTPITFGIPSVILAQFSVSCAFAVRTMRVAFEQQSPRTEMVALTLGCTRNQAFWYVAIPEAWRAIVAAACVAWARALGEFGPILIFAGATRQRTEVLSTTVFLELSIGKLHSAIAVSMLMIAVAVTVLVIMRLVGLSVRER